jgi:hypothetical protein
MHQLFKIRLSALAVSASFLAHSQLGFASSNPPLPAHLSEMRANDKAMSSIGTYLAWARGYTGLGSRIGFVDTGADLKSNDLKNVILSKNPYGTSITDVNFGHGTSMISIAAGAKDGAGVVGVAYNASVLAYAGGRGGALNVNDVSNGIRWNADNRADVINLSMGINQTPVQFNLNYTSMGNGNYALKSNVVDPYSNTTLLPALQYATSKGSIVVMAAGNDGNPVPTSPANLAVKVDTTGNLILGGRAVIVGAVDSKNVIASFSNRAGNICQSMSNNACTDKIQIKDYFLVAPGGTAVWGASANKQGQITSSVGTSVSAAFVSGAIGVIKQAWQTLKPEQIVQVLLKTSTDLGKPGVDEVYGNGLVNLEAATKPIGALTLAKITSTSTTQIAAGPVALSTSNLAGGILNKSSFSGSSVLQNTQVVDSMGRNFTVNMTGGVATSMQTYNPVSAYSSLSLNNIKRVDFENAHGVESFFHSDNLNGVKLNWALNGKYALSFEFGNASEFGSILGSRGTGAFALGDSSTNWSSFGLTKQLNSYDSLYSSLGYGVTKANSTTDSLLTGFSQIITQTWTLGAKRKEIFDDKDSLAFQVTELPAIVSGAATVTAVTGYQYDNVTEEGANATPVTSNEQVNLATSYRQYATSLSYARKITKFSDMRLNFVIQSDNAGSDLKSMIYLGYNKNF